MFGSMEVATVKADRPTSPARAMGMRTVFMVCTLGGAKLPLHSRVFH
jgi:hypothetical protein